MSIVRTQLMQQDSRDDTCPTYYLTITCISVAAAGICLLKCFCRCFCCTFSANPDPKMPCAQHKLTLSTRDAITCLQYR